MSMFALCASRVSWTSIGRACSLISRSRWLPLGDTGTSTLVIVPSVTVIATCTGPQRVSAESPVYVFVPDDADDDDPDEDEGDDDGSGGAAAEGVADGAAGALVAEVPAADAAELVEVW